MLKMKGNKRLSGPFVFAGLAYGVLLFFVALVWLLPERSEVISHFRLYMMPAVFFGLTGRLIYDKGQGRAETAGKWLMAIGYLSCGAFIGLFVYTFMTGK